ncbi:MAG: hypothetical protein ABTQ27_00585 [Amaricoccus sp.]|uniref:M10 family metallopeptidase C-terminal domain-containing protein n=1 Tax=Amaricoccus sp. TaxID=1872485 RepID=UPI00331566F0
MTVKITLAGKSGVDFNKEYDAFFKGFAPSGSPLFLGESEEETTQIVHLDTPVTGKESAARAVLLDGDDFLYTFSNHTISGEIDKVSLVTLGDAYDKDTGDLDLHGGVVTTATPHITFSGLDIENEPGVAGPVHKIVAGMMGGGPSGTAADPAALTKVLFGEAQSLVGSAGDDKYSGTRFGDTIRGMRGDDTLSGRGGADKLIGGLGADRLTGGSGADQFIFQTVAETRGDKIRDFDSAENDLIHLSKIDANEDARGNNRFSFIGDDAFSGEAGELRFKSGASGTTVYGDTDGDGRADFKILLVGDHDLSAGDFIL